VGVWGEFSGTRVGYVYVWYIPLATALSPSLLPPTHTWIFYPDADGGVVL